MAKEGKQNFHHLRVNRGGAVTDRDPVSTQRGRGKVQEAQTMTSGLHLHASVTDGEVMTASCLPQEEASGITAVTRRFARSPGSLLATRHKELVVALNEMPNGMFHG